MTAAAALFALMSVAAASAGVELDSGFGDGGRVFTPISEGIGGDRGVGVAVQDDGKVVVAGTASMQTTGNDFAAVRYETDGDLDPMFGGGDGIVTVPVSPGNGSDHATEMAMQGDGKIVIVGEVNTGPGGATEFGVVRLGTNGLPDPAFDDDGIATTSLSGGEDNHSGALAVTVTPTGIVAGGYADTDPELAENYDFGLVKYELGDGDLDASFDGPGGDGNGKFAIQVAPESGDDEIFALTSAGEAIYAGGQAQMTVDGDSYDFALAKLDAGGALDAAFDGDGGSGNGIVTTPVGPGEDKIDTLAIDGAGRALAAGYADDAGGITDSAFARYSGTTGVLDPSFDGGVNGNGRFALPLSVDTDQINDLTFDAQGRILAAGGLDVDPTDQNNQDMMAVRLNGSDGALDPSFDGEGVKTVAYAADSGDFATGIALDAEERILLGGHTNTPGSGTGVDFAAVRLIVDEDPPTTTITKGPKRRTTDRTPTFKFRADEQNVTFECSVDKRAFRKCASPLTLKRLSLGRHRFRVKATDAAGNVEDPPAVRRFRVVRRG